MADQPDLHRPPCMHFWTAISRVDGRSGARQLIGYTCLRCGSARETRPETIDD